MGASLCAIKKKGTGANRGWKEATRRGGEVARNWRGGRKEKEVKWSNEKTNKVTWEGKEIAGEGKSKAEETENLWFRNQSWNYIKWIVKRLDVWDDGGGRIADRSSWRIGRI